MLQIQIGDILTETLGKECVIIHGVNAQGVMLSGFAKLVRDLYPHTYLTYKQAERRYGLKVGQVIVWNNQEEGPSVASAVTQEFYGRTAGKVYINYEAIIVAMQSVVKMFGHEFPIHLPMIGGGLGGGDVKRLTAIYQAVFHNCNATLWLQDE